MASQRLVIDACIAQASGTRENPRSALCRGLLLEVREICHRLVLTARLNDEWKKHRSNFARTWLTSMYARKKVDYLDLPAGGDPALQEALRQCTSSQKDIEAMLKDLPLVEAALASDRRLLSVDEKARRLYVAAAASMGQFRQVIWMNPEDSPEDWRNWLRAGAPPVRTLMLEE